MTAPQCCMCGKRGLSTVEGDGGTECELSDGRWVCSGACWDRATDTSPALGAAAMKRAAMDMCLASGTADRIAKVALGGAYFGIKSIPAPNHAALLADALRLPEVAALVEWMRSKTRDIETRETMYDDARADIFVGELLEMLGTLEAKP